MTTPPPIPPWKRSKPRESRDGKSVWVDLMVVAENAERDAAFGVKPAYPNPMPNRKPR